MYTYDYSCGGWPLIKSNERKTNNMSKISILLKRLLDSDTKKLIKAGYVDNEIEITSRGKDALLIILFDANKAVLVKMAEERIAEEEAEK